MCMDFSPRLHEASSEHVNRPAETQPLIIQTSPDNMNIPDSKVHGAIMGPIWGR